MKYVDDDIFSQSFALLHWGDAPLVDAAHRKAPSEVTKKSILLTDSQKYPFCWPNH